MVSRVPSTVRSMVVVRAAVLAPPLLAVETKSRARPVW